MDERNLDLASAFDSARELTEPTLEDRARNGKALAAKLGAAALLAAAPAKAAFASTAAVTQGAALKGAKLVLLMQVAPALLAGAVLGVGAAWSGALLEPASKPEPSPAPGPAAATPKTLAVPAPIEPPAEENVAVPAINPKAAAPPSAAFGRQAHPAADPAAPGCTGADCDRAVRAFPQAGAQMEASELGNELALISRMHAAWRAGDFASVGSAIRAHEQRFPKGSLAEEREAMKIMVSCRSSSRDLAAQLASAYVKQHAASPYAARVNAACSGRSEPR
jgi:hypothetical protein